MKYTVSIKYLKCHHLKIWTLEHSQEHITDKFCVDVHLVIFCLKNNDIIVYERHRIKPNRVSHLYKRTTTTIPTTFSSLPPSPIPSPHLRYKTKNMFWTEKTRFQTTYLISSNSPSGGMKLMLCSVSNLLSFTHW